MTTTLTPEQQKAIAAMLAEMPLSRGIGDRFSCCSIAAINLALNNRHTDDIPMCMSPVIGNWIIRVQDEMPWEMRNGATWKGLLSLAAGTGREFEQERGLIASEWAVPAQAEVFTPSMSDPLWLGEAHQKCWESLNPCGTLERLIAVGGQPTTALAS